MAGETEILHNINLRVYKGECHVVMGRNGSGKSTLLNAIMGAPGLICDGKVVWEGIDNLLAMTVDVRTRQGIFLSTQAPPEIQGISNAKLLQGGMESMGKPHELRDILKGIHTVAEELNLPKSWALRGFNVGASGGERKKNELLHLKVLDPKLCLLDEIEAGLDKDATDHLVEMLKTIQIDRTMLMVSHSPKVNATHVHVMEKGKIVKSGGPEIAEHILSKGYDDFI
jgi:Fe-S cluster assembly ATP-binding protein